MGKQRSVPGRRSGGGGKSSSGNKRPQKKPPIKRDRAAAIKAELRAQNLKPKPSAVAKAEEQQQEEESDVGEEDFAFMDEHEDYAKGFLGSIQNGSDLRMVGKRHQTSQEKRERRVRPRTVESSGPSTTRPLPSKASQPEAEVDGIRKASTRGWEAADAKKKNNVRISTMRIG